jgi:hypothetical protein
MGVYEESIIPIKIAQLAEYVSKTKRISLDDALVYIYINPMYERLYDEDAERAVVSVYEFDETQLDH